jgi:site-specific DNA-methyltransferase (adenine-specific)
VKENGWHRKVQPRDLRSFFPQTERVIFCEQFGADGSALRGSGYAAECQKLHAGVFEPLRQYLETERKRAGVDKIAINVACGFSASAGGMASRHYFSGSQWCLPTREHYAAMQALFGAGYLRREYEDLRREYEDLRREYEDLRRPFTVSSEVPYTDVWTYKTVPAGRGKHPCEKPLPMLRDIVNASSRPGGLVLDSFAGSGATGQAAVELDRRFVGIEMDPVWAERARERIGCSAQTLPLGA